jgi:hypothetical protein
MEKIANEKDTLHKIGPLIRMIKSTGIKVGARSTFAMRTRKTYLVRKLEDKRSLRRIGRKS